MGRGHEIRGSAIQKEAGGGAALAVRYGGGAIQKEAGVRGHIPKPLF